LTAVDLTSVRLDKGKHDNPGAGACLLEVVSLLAGEPFSDDPACASPILGDYGRALNDALPDARRQRLIPYAPRIVGTAGDGLDEARGYIALDWLIRTYTPAWLDLADFAAEAAALRDLDRVGDLETIKAAVPVLWDAQNKTNAAWATLDHAVRDIAWVTTDAAARETAWDGAVSSTRTATGDGDGALHAAHTYTEEAAKGAARFAAGTAAWAPAWNAAWDRLAPTVDRLQDSGIVLFDALIRGVP
jgi:hypothetical protein